MKLAFFSALVSAASWNYNNQGDDWYTMADPAVEDDYTLCATGSQSPIDLSESFKTIKGGQDMWVSGYSTWGATATRSFGHETVKYSADPSEEGSARGVPSSYFTSHYMLDMGATGSFEVAQFHIHHKSEHTVDGEQMDAEIHWVHFADGLGDGTLADDENYAIASALGIMF